MVNYNLGKIYKLVDNTNGDIYIGSTCEPTLARRLWGHTKKFRLVNKGNTKEKLTSYNIIKNGNYDIILIEAYPCENKMELHRRERYYIDTNDCVNKLHPTRTKKEYYKENIETLKAKGKVYRNNNKERILERVKEYTETNKEKVQKWKNTQITCECGHTYTQANKARHLKSQKHCTEIVA